MIYKILFTDTIGGVKQSYVKFDYEFLKGLKRIRENRPAGESEDDEYQERYFKGEKTKGKKHRKEVASQFGKYGFKPWVKQFKIGECNGIFFIQDGQNSRGAIIDLNEASLIESGNLLYNEFSGIVIHYEGNRGYWEMVEDMRDMNNCASRWTTGQFTNSADEGRVRDAMLYINEKTGLQEDQCTKLLFGDLNKSEYPNKKMVDACTYWMEKTHALEMLYNNLRDMGNEIRIKKFKSGDGFIVFNALLNRIYNYPSKNNLAMSEEEMLKWADKRVQILMDMVCKITEDGFVRNILTNINSSDKIPHGRQTWYRLFLGRLFKNDSGCHKLYMEDKILKGIIDDWAYVPEGNYLKASSNVRV